MTQKELSERMSSAEYTEWIALANLQSKQRRQAEAKANTKRGRF